MSVLKSFAGQNFNLPLNREPKSSNWGTEVSNFLIRVADYALPKTGGLFALTSELSLGSSHGIKLPYIKSSSAAISTESPAFMLLANADRLSWRNAADDGNLALSISATNRLQWTGQDLQLATDASSSNTGGKLVLRDGSGDFAARNITASSFIGPISGGVTGNVTGNLTGNADTASKLQTARTVTLSGDVGGSVSFDGSANVTITTAINADSVALGTDTTGNYVASVSGTADQVIASGTGEGAAVTLSLPQSIATSSSPTFQKLTLSGTPSGATDAVTKDYVDSVAKGLDVKDSVLVATTANITLSGTQTIDGVAVAAGDRILVKNQSTTSQNGIYIAAAGAWARSSDMDSWAKVPGAFAFVEQGSSLADTGWVSTANAGGTLGSTAIAFTQFFGQGTYSADGQGIELAGTQFALELDGTSLAKSGSGLKVNVAGSPVGTSDTQTLLNKKMSSTSAMTGALELPGGTTAERPASPAAGQIRYNSENLKFEGYSGSWDSIGGGGGLVTVPQSSNFTALAGKHYLCNTTGGAITVTLPAGAAEAAIKFSDASETWDSYAVTITPASGQKIDNLATNESLVCDVKRGWVELSWNTALSSWSIQSLSATNVVEASATQAGVVTTVAQTFAGDKTYSGTVTAGKFIPTSSSATGNGLYLPTSDTVALSTAGSERVRVNSSGNVGINTAAPTGRVHIAGDNSSPSLVFNDTTRDIGYAGFLQIGTWDGTTWALKALLYDNGYLNLPNSLSGTGNRAVYSDGGGTLTNTSSDGTLKTDVEVISQGLETVLSLKPVSFNWIDTGRMGEQREIGFIAQEVRPLVPEVVGSNNDGTLSVDYPKMVAVLTKAIQELSAKVDAQAAQLAQLLPPVEPAPVEVVEPQPIVEVIEQPVEVVAEPVIDAPAEVQPVVDEPVAVVEQPVEPLAEQTPVDQDPV